MEIGSVLRESRVNAKMSVEQVSDILTENGFKASKKTVYSWENGNSRPDIEVLMKLCDMYGIKDILRTFGYDGYNEDGSIQLNMKEIDMIEKYRELDPHGKKMVDFTLNEEWERSKAGAKAAEKVVPMTVHEDTTYVNAAHDDENSTPEERQAGDDIMMDDSEWE